MKTKLTHRLPAKAAAMFLFTAAVLFMFICIGGMQAYTHWDTVMDDPWLSQAMPLRNIQPALPWLGISAAVIAVGLFIFLMCAAGRRKGSEEPVCSRLDRAPFDLLLAAVLAILFGMGSIVSSSVSWSGIGSVVLAVGIFIAVGAPLLMMLCMTFAVRVKTGTFWRNNVIAAVLRFVWKCLRFVWRGVRAVYENLSVLWKLVVSYVGFGLVCMALFAAGMSGGFALFLFFIVALAGLGALCFLGLQLQRVKQGGEALAQGRMEERIDTSHLVLDIKAHAETLNSIGLGMGRAVEARLKSERMKTDLITNVSHDIKTPLTSIVNYVDLLQKEELGNEAAKGYLEVLSRQAQRLKKLTEDIVEASKASSGALNVSLAPTDAAELVHQSLAEYAERFALSDLTPVAKLPEGLPLALADGRLLWRVADNLFSNACKYSMPGTRVYVEAGQSGTTVNISVKSISREAIGVPAEELSERFARGDASRATEGSGLGLSIAKSLMELQNGELRLAVDGDLFKAELTLPAAV
ncbi:MAG TPA: HAMP domain-containing sensor histidine kinase [Feifaniaceae bacterium]|nr:HAMP domain-containing sensor histidine kinase [Feifaniaceae bacterium]